MNFYIKDFFSKYDQIRRRLRIWSHLLKKFLMENCIFYVVNFVMCQCICLIQIKSWMSILSFIAIPDFHKNVGSHATQKTSKFLHTVFLLTKRNFINGIRNHHKIEHIAPKYHFQKIE